MVFVNILILTILITKAQQFILNQKLVYQMEVSEFCKRRVLPSIFLARNSINTNAFVMRFSQIELPFSCPISVRTESGNNIIMVIKPLSSKKMMKRCKKNAPELLVHEMGETFGGYWGPISKNVFEHKSVKPKIYTLKTTQSTTTIETTSPEHTEPETTKTKIETKISEDAEEDGFISVDMPLVNVSGKFLVVGDGKYNASEEDEDAMFDSKFNVTPEPGGDYETSMIPIVQFSVKSHPGWRKEGDDGEPRFDLDIVEKYTPDHRLTRPLYKSTRLLRFKTYSMRTTTKHGRQFFRKNSTKRKLQSLRFTSHKYTSYDFPTTKTSNSLQNISKVHSWKTIEELINKVNLTSSLQREGNKKLSDKKNQILQKFSDAKHNFSVHLKPNLSMYDSSKPNSITEVKMYTFSTTKLTQTHTKYTTKRKASNQVMSTLTKLINQTKTSVGYSPLKKLDSTPSDINNNYYHKGQNTSSIVTKETDKKTGPTEMVDKSLVDHESWENVVQAAPDMAVLLNIATDEMKKHEIVTSNGTAHKRKRRKKREIHAIEISNARPHNATTKYPITWISSSKFRVADMQELSQLVELQDDELYGRLALRFLRRFVGPVIYNICDFNTTSKQHHIHLINASRIVITLNNFTDLSGLTLILTTARALVAGETECPASNIECQVAGARVCIDSMSACDGVPNCGSDDVYDEDRLKCGASEGLQHNVYIAAFTFLAVVLTLLYSVHYWLRRCVPKVADAFFIYTNGTENVLLLEPKMRSPHDLYNFDQSSNQFFRTSLWDADIDMTEETRSNCWKTFMKILCCGITGREKAIKTPSIMNKKEEISNYNPQKKFSFTQLQIQNMMGMTKNSIQSNSIELTSINNKKIDKPVSTTISLISVDSILTLEEPLPEDYKDELGLLRFLKTARKSSERSDSERQFGTEDGFSKGLEKNSQEMEIKTTDYHSHRLGEPGPSGVQNKKEQLPKPGPSGKQTTKQVGRKHLRFNNNNTMIPASITEVDENEEIDEPPRSHQRYSTFLDTVMGKQKFFGTNDDGNESPLPKEHKRFWSGSGRAKKPNRNKNAL